MKASLKDRGSGRLEFVDNTLKFYVERGRFRKKSELLKEIALADVESAAVVGKEFSVTWKGVADIFEVETAEQAEAMCEQVNAVLKEKTKSLEGEETTREETAKQERNELANVLRVAMEITDSLFDVLRNLQGRVDWNQVESALMRSEENAKSFTSDKMGTINLDFTKLSSAIKTHRAGEVSKETYGVLKSMYEYFKGLTVADESLQKVHPNCEDAKLIIQAHYTLNDMILGTVVGDKEVENESAELAAVLEDLSKATDLKIDFGAVKAAANNLITEKAKESVIEESRALFKEQLKELVTA